MFEATKLYAGSGRKWGWVPPASINDAKLRHVWETIEKFFDGSFQKRRTFAKLFDKLTAPPTGLREGLLPLMVAAGFQAFGKCLALREEVEGGWLYVDDITPTLIERICEQPTEFELESVSLTSTQSMHLRRMVLRLAEVTDSRESDLVRAFHDGLISWRSRLPASALKDPDLGKFASRLQVLLRKRSFDPFHFLFWDLPEAMESAPFHKKTSDKFIDSVSEIEGAAQRVGDEAVEIAKDLLNRRIAGPYLPLLEAACSWAGALPLNDAALRSLDHETRGIVNRARATNQEAYTETGFVTALSGILLGTRLDEWDEGAAARFKGCLEDALDRAERAALESAHGSKRFEPFVKNRLSSIVDQLTACIGANDTKRHLEELIGERLS